MLPIPLVLGALSISKLVGQTLKSQPNSSAKPGTGATGLRPHGLWTWSGLGGQIAIFQGEVIDLQLFKQTQMMFAKDTMRFTQEEYRSDQPNAETWIQSSKARVQLRKKCGFVGFSFER